VIKVGAATEVELKGEKHRIEDAVSRRAQPSRRHHPPAAERPWFTPPLCGGGLGLTGDEALGVQVFVGQSDEPLRWIAENAGPRATWWLPGAGREDGLNAATASRRSRLRASSTR